MTDADLRRQAEQIVRGCGAARWQWIRPENIEVTAAFRTSCAMNQCGQFGRCWSCPPAIPAVARLHSRMLSYDAGLVFQADYAYTDDFDYEAMEAGALDFYRLCRCVEAGLARLPARFLVLGAGRCRECETCTYPEKPCVRAQGPVYSLEAFGVDVTALCQSAGLPYILDSALVPYTALALLSAEP